MYILAEFNNKWYFIAECLNSSMMRELAKFYSSYFSGVTFNCVNDVFGKSDFSRWKTQLEFIKDYKATHHLAAQIDYTPLDNP